MKFSRFIKSLGFDHTELADEQLDGLHDMYAISDGESEPEPQEEAENKNLKASQVQGSLRYDTHVGYQIG